MTRKIFYSIAIIAVFLAVHLLGFWFWKPKTMPLRMQTIAFSELPGWEKANLKPSFHAFQKSCKAFLKQPPNKSTGSPYIPLQAKDWQPACRAAKSVSARSNEAIKRFFQAWFKPVALVEDKPVQGLFTGYYMSLLHGSLEKTKRYHVPIYGVPNNLVMVNLGLFDASLEHHKTIVGRLQGKQLVPFYTRAAINEGAIAENAPVIAWVDNSVDRAFLEIQGSGIIKLPDGSQIVVGYAAENGAPYTSIARVLIDQGVMTRDNASMQRIRQYFETHPEDLHKVLNQNKSFVFFSKLPQEVALGAQGVALTPGYSLAVDRKWIPLGMPMWLQTTRPDARSERQKDLQRLMIAQDTGGAIRGVVRGDVYWGAGKRATAIAGKMKNIGRYWLLLPRHTKSL